MNQQENPDKSEAIVDDDLYMVEEVHADLESSYHSIEMDIETVEGKTNHLETELTTMIKDIEFLKSVSKAHSDVIDQKLDNIGISSATDITNRQVELEQEEGKQLEKQSAAGNENEMEKLKNVIEELKKENDEKHLEFEQFKEEVSKLIEENNGLKGKINGKRRTMKKMKEEMSEMKIEMFEVKEEMEEKNDEFEEQIKELKGEVAKLAGENGKLKKQMENKGRALGEMKKEIAKKNIIFEEQITNLKKEDIKLAEKSAELMEKKADKVLANILSKHVDQLNIAIESLQLDAMKNNKLNLADSGPLMNISKNEFISAHLGPNEFNSVRAALPIPKFNPNAKKSYIAFYFECKILKQQNSSIGIGFCDQEFPLEGEYLGNRNNSIGIWNKEGIQIDESYIPLPNAKGHFKAGDMVGCGLIHSPTNPKVKCFASCQGKLLGIVDLPDKFADLQLFPAVTLYYKGDSIEANFINDGWRFHPHQLVQ